MSMPEDAMSKVSTDSLGVTHKYPLFVRFRRSFLCEHGSESLFDSFVRNFGKSIDCQYWTL